MGTRRIVQLYPTATDEGIPPAVVGLGLESELSEEGEGLRDVHGRQDRDGGLFGRAGRGLGVGAGRAHG